MPLESIRELVQSDFDAVNNFIIDRLRSQTDLIDELSQHLINSGGKRIRPLLVLLSAKANQYQGKAHIPVAAILEYFHTATLLHDDVVDDSSLRRGLKTANLIWGNQASILVGDYLFAESFKLMIDHGNTDVLKVLIDTASTITRGEVQQYVNCNDPKVTEAEYMEIIANKTSMLFSTCAQMGAILAERSPQEIKTMQMYGLHLGNGFQLIDDALDYCASKEAIGKNIGDDFAQGKVTLPLIHALNHGSNEEKKLIAHAIEHNEVDNLPAILKAIENTDAIAYTYKIAKQHSQIAINHLEKLPDSKYKKALEDLAQFAIARTQ